MKSKSTFKRLFIQEYAAVTFELTNSKRGQVSPVEDLSYPDYYIGMITSGSCETIGKVYFDEYNGKTKVYFYPNRDAYLGFDVESIGCLNKYINLLQKSYKELKK